MGGASNGGRGGLDLLELNVWGSFLVDICKADEAERRFKMLTF
jgi:hypothetical protein